MNTQAVRKAEERIVVLNAAAQTIKGIVVKMQNDTKKKKSKAQLILSSESNEWYTPPNFMSLVYQVMVVDLDPCSNAARQVVARKHYVGANNQDGLLLPWNGSIFMNPPYGGKTGIWCDKLIKEDPEESIVLIKAATDTGYFHKMAGYADCYLLRKGRIQFIPSEEQKEKWSVTDDLLIDQGKKPKTHGSTIANVVFYKGENADQFIKVFGQYGLVVDNR